MGSTAASTTLLPMKATLGPLPPNGTGWVYEVKWDGYRALVHVDRAAASPVRITSSNGLDLTARWPELAGLADAVNADRVVLDGEVAVLDASGRSSFGQLARGEGTATFIAFDLLSLNGTDTTSLGLEQRRRLLEAVLEPGPHWALSPVHDDGETLAAVTADAGMEGVVAKRIGSVYLAGTRSPAWRKVKHRRRQELVVVGWQEGDRSRQSTFGSLILGVVDDGRLRFAGSVGTGFDQRTLVSLTTKLTAIERDTPPLEVAPPKGAVTRPHWVEPRYVAEIEFAEWTDDGIVRHASFLGLRDDKPWQDVVREGF